MSYVPENQILYKTVGTCVEPLELQIERHGSVTIFTLKNTRFQPVATVCLDLETGTISNLLVDRPYRRKGLARELFSQIHAFAKEHTSLDRLKASTHPHNVGAKRLLKDLGYFRLDIFERRI